MRGQTVLEAESLREVEDVRELARSEGGDGAEANVPRQPEDAGGGDAVALRARHVMLAVGGSAREVEAEEIVAGLLRAAVRPGERGAPARLRRVRLVEL